MGRWKLALLNKINLRLLGKQLDEIAETPYFRPALTAYLSQLREAVKRLLEQYESIPQPLTNAITNQVWSATKFLAGSTSKRIPYEIAYGLRLVLKDWEKEEAVVTTAITQDLRHSFYFEGVSKEFYMLVEAFLDVKFDAQLVQIALPQIYRHRPLYNVALYHELGHFLDVHHGVTKLTLVIAPPDKLALPGVDSSQIHGLDLEVRHNNHRMEYFADLFAASYAGRAYGAFLGDFAKDYDTSPTHPSTADRLSNIEDFLSGRSNPIIAVLQAALTSQGLPALEIHYRSPAITSAFDNVRPYPIASDEEVHGIFEAGYQYLQSALKRDAEPWANMSEGTVEAIVNDLVEKSIRNRMIVANWDTNGSAIGPSS